MKRIGLAVAALLLLTACTRSGAPALRVVREITDLDPVPALPAWSDTRIAFNDAQRHPAVAHIAGTAAPTAVSDLTAAAGPIWSPDGNSVVFAGPRPDTMTVYMQAVGGGAPVDLLPGAQATRGVSGTKMGLHWLDPATLAFAEHMGSGVQEIRLVDVGARQAIPLSDTLGATFFTWAPDDSRVAGQWDGPAPFWVYDFRTKGFLKLPAPLPGEQQWFEGWLDRDRCLFTAWTGGFPYRDGAGTPTLYLLNFADGSVAKVADAAYLARGAGDQIAYVTAKAPASLVVADAAGKAVWQAELGALPGGRNVWEFQPRVNGRHVLYRMATGEWRVSPVSERRPALVHAAQPRATSDFSPDGRFLAVLEQELPPKLQILALP